MFAFFHSCSNACRNVFASLLWISVCFACQARADEKHSDYLNHVRPLLEEKCWSCHGVLRQEAGLRLDTRQMMVEDAGAVSPGDVDASLLIERVVAGDTERMPPAGEGARLTDEEIRILKRWIAAGAPAPDETTLSGPEDHWAFQSILKSPTELTSVDQILDKQRQSRGLSKLQKADRKLAIRRLYIDLIGLPPTLSELNDSRPWDEIVDQLLADPRHGERWGRHWMDVWRYSDWYGLGEQLRYSQKHIWHWRDWIIRSLNEDKGYDRMVMEMLAGDELAPNASEVVSATGFLARNYYLFNRTTWLDSTIEHTGKAFLGLTLNCAKCHDHKYDPISQRDYYQFRAIFEPHQIRLDPLPGVTNLEQDGLPRAFDDHLDAVTQLHRRGDPANPDPEIVIQPSIPELFREFAAEIQVVELPTEAYAPIMRQYVQDDMLAVAEKKTQQAESDLEKWKAEPTEEQRGAILNAAVIAAKAELAAIRGILAAEETKFSMGMETSEFASVAIEANRLQAERDLAVAQHDLLVAGEDAKKKEAAASKITQAEKRLQSAKDGSGDYQPPRVSRKALETPAHNFETYGTSYSKQSTGRRLALARWVTDRRNPLTARVAVNHVWMRHFNQPLVESVFDFGLRAKSPKQAELLDFLAWEFVESGWSFRHLHRLIVTSEAYQLSSSTLNAPMQNIENDPNNEFYWRMNPRRQESQVVRDSLLHLAGELDGSMFGPSIAPGPASRRRSLYFQHSRDQQDLFLSTFDDADHLACYRRSESIVPQQALALANSKLTFEMAPRIARRLDDDLAIKDFVAKVFEVLMARLPDQDELEACEEFCRRVRELNRDKEASEQERLVRDRLVHALLNHNDFVTVR